MADRAYYSKLTPDDPEAISVDLALDLRFWRRRQWPIGLHFICHCSKLTPDDPEAISMNLALDLRFGRWQWLFRLRVTCHYS